MHVKITITFAINAVLTLLLVVLPSLATEETRGMYYALTMATAVLYGTSVALLQVTLYGIAGISFK